MRRSSLQAGERVLSHGRLDLDPLDPGGLHREAADVHQVHDAVGESAPRGLPGGRTRPSPSARAPSRSWGALQAPRGARWPAMAPCAMQVGRTAPIAALRRGPVPGTPSSPSRVPRGRAWASRRRRACGSRGSGAGPASNRGRGGVGGLRAALASGPVSPGSRSLRTAISWVSSGVSRRPRAPADARDGASHRSASNRDGIGRSARPR